MGKINLKYPVLLIHGMGFRDSKLLNYWGRIPEALEEMGCRVFFGEQEADASVETNAEIIRERIDEIIDKTSAEKVNIIAHSKGGLEARYVVSSLGMGGKVASVTTIATPHNGSRTVDMLLKLPDGIVKMVAFFTDVWFRIIGDKKPASYENFHLFSTKGAERFNCENPDCEDVYYQSYAFVMKNALSDIIMWFPHIAVSVIEGENDGLLTPENARWTNFKGVFKGNGIRGISHCDQVDMRRRRLTRKKGENISDILKFYRDVVRDLAERGL